jgi:hypothetical protein
MTGHAQRIAGPQPDGTEGIANIVLSVAKDNTDTKIKLKGCIVKKDDQFLSTLLTATHSDVEYFVCMPNYKAELPPEHRLVNIEVDIYRFRKKCYQRKCKNIVLPKDEVDKVVIIRDNHCFLPCGRNNFNTSSFLKKYSKIINSSLPSNLCEIKVFGVKEGQGRPQYFSFDLRQQDTAGYYSISSQDLENVEFCSSLYASQDDASTGPDMKHAQVIGFYKKESRQISITTFENQGK